MSRISIAVWLMLWPMLGLASAQAQTAPAMPPCRADRISNSSGLMIRLGTGQTYKAFPGSRGTMGSWLPMDKLTVCPIGGGAVSITNLSKKDSTVKATRVSLGSM